MGQELNRYGHMRPLMSELDVRSATLRRAAVEITSKWAGRLAWCDALRVAAVRRDRDGVRMIDKAACALVEAGPSRGIATLRKSAADSMAGLALKPA